MHASLSFCMLNLELFSLHGLNQEQQFIMRKMRKDGSISYRGYCIDLLNELARMLKFTYEIYPSPDGLYGAETENGTWNGMVGELVSKVTADVHYVHYFTRLWN